MTLTPEQIQALDQHFNYKAPNQTSSLTPDKISTLDEHFGIKPKQQAIDTPSFSQRLQGDWEKRVGEGQAATDAYMQGKQSLPLTYLDYAGKIGAGTGSDIVKEATKSAVDVLPQGIKNAGGYVRDYAMGDYQGSNPYGLSLKPLAGAASYLGNQYQDFARRFPDEARHVEAIANIGSFVAPAIPFKGTSIANTAVDAAASTAKAGTQALTNGGGKAIDAVKGIFPERSIAKSSLAESAAIDREAAGNAYKLSADEDVQFTPDALNSLQSKLAQLAPKSDAERRVWGKSGASEHVNDLMDSLSTEPLSMNGALAQRTALNDSISAASRSGKKGEVSHLMQVKNALDSTMINPDTGTWQAANHKWGIAATKQDIVDLVTSAEGKAQPANSLDTNINRYLISYQGKALPANERAALQMVVKNGSMAELGKTLGTRLISHVATGVGAGVGGVPGAMVGHLAGTYGSMFARDMAMANKLKKLDAVFSAIESRTPPTVAPPVPKAPMLQITNQRPNTVAQRYADSLRKTEHSGPVIYGERPPEPAPQLQLPPKDKMTLLNNIPGPQGKLPGPSLDTLYGGARQPNKFGKASPFTTEKPQIPITPNGQLGQLQLSLKGAKRGQLDNIAAALQDGSLSQNKFVFKAQAAFGLSPKEALQLAKEIRK